MSPWAETTLFAAARAELVGRVIGPALAEGKDVVCDRYVDSSVAYQGIARGLGLERVLELNLAAVGGLMPERTILLEIGVSDAAARMTVDLDRIEREGEAFRGRVAAAYVELAGRFPDRYLTVPGTGTPHAIAEEIYGALRGDS